jgi:hypothetical protein
MKNTYTFRTIVFLLLFLCSFARTVLPQSVKTTRVILDRETFRAETRDSLQSIADQVAALVDSLIPGQGKDYPEEGIICFEASRAWSSDIAHPAPITLVGPKLMGEPAATKSNTIRIALNGIQPFDKWRLAYQLSHELAHVKMGTRIDNYLYETFAVAVSFEVLRRLGFQGYLLRVKGEEIQSLPEVIQENLTYNKWADLESYWQSRSTAEGEAINDRPIQTLGAILLERAHQPNWPMLLRVSEFSVCASSPSPNSFQLCPPDISRMKG